MKKEDVTLKKENIESKQDKTPAIEKTITTKRKRKVTKYVFIEANGNQIDVEELKQNAEEQFLKQHPDEKILDIKIYINASEGNAYYVVNGKADESFKIMI